MPANTASVTPAANTIRYNSRMSTPSDCAISRFVAPARIAMPRRVRAMIA
jgi:hypothetical protein